MNKQVTKKQKEIFSFLYQFRFLDTTHFQSLFHHKLPTRTKMWLKDLKDKGYINRIYDKSTYERSSTPAIYYLAPKARRILKEEGYNINVLNLVYKEHKRTEKFINHCLFIADCFLFFSSGQGKNEELNFFTKTELVKYRYFPRDLPDAYISIESKDEDRKFFLDIFDAYTPGFVLERRLKTYIKYSDSEKWKKNTNENDLPMILFICANNQTKKNIYEYAVKKLRYEFNKDISLFLTTKDQVIKENYNKNIWQEVNQNN